MGEPPYASTCRLLKSYFLASGLCEQIDHRGHEHGVSYMLRSTVSQNACGLNLELDLAGPKCRGREHAGKICDVEDRSGVQIDPPSV